MNLDEFAFFNQQLARMLRDGIPLEGALKQLSKGMRSEKFRGQVVALEADLTRGTPLETALTNSQFPELYRRMVEIGAKSNDLPGTLTLLADHYHRVNLVWTRLKGLMVYPVVLILVSLGLTLLISLVFGRFISGLMSQYATPTPVLLLSMWIPPITMAVLAVLAVVAFSWPVARERLRWRLPGFREASLAQLASAVALMLRNGTPLADALAMAQQLEKFSPAGPALGVWRTNVAAGAGKPALWGAAPAPFPPLFLWLIQQGGEDLAAGFDKAAEIYRERANYRIELALYGALPVSVLFLGLMVLWQMVPVIHNISSMMRMLSDMGG